MKRCSTCRYRAAKTDDNGCDYFLLTGKRRGCPVDDCIRYEEGDNKKLPTHMRSEFTPGKLRKTPDEYEQYRGNEVMC